MDQVSLVKSDYRKTIWVENIKACKSSGMTVKAWCESNNVNVKSYYYWLRKLREELCEIVPNVVPVCNISSSNTVVIRSGNITAEIPDGTSAETINAVVKAVAQC